MFERLKNTLIKKQSFEVVLFWGVLAASIVAAIFSAVFSAIEGVDPLTVIGCVVLLLLLSAIGFVSYKTGDVDRCYFVMCIIICVVVLPPLFFTCGGFNSGMPFYCLTAMLVLSLCAKAILRVILVCIAVVVDSTIFMLAWEHPEWCSKVEFDVAITDIVVSLIFMSAFIFAVVSFLLSAYHREKYAKDTLIEQLNYNSTHDVLTGLFNRRRFIEFLNEYIMPSPRDLYVLMYDVDHFKHINDTYGHLAGDDALAAIANVAKQHFNKQAEVSVRYGGEEFIQVIASESLQGALQKAESFRQSIANIAFDENPEMKIRVSGGLVSCDNACYGSYGKLLSSVDALLYQAKMNGRNQIVCEG